MTKFRKQMQAKKFSFMFAIIVMALSLLGCARSYKNSQRETIFDEVISIPKYLVLDIPKLLPLCDAMIDLKRGFINVKNGKLYYEEEGNGSLLVLINGGSGGTHHGFHPHFSQIKDFARVIYYDQRGTGQSSKDSSGKTYTIKQAVEDLEGLRKALKIEKWSVLGWSYGGFLAQCYALAYPERVTGLILVASADGLTRVQKKSSREQMFISKSEQDAIKKVRIAYNKGKLTEPQLIYNIQLCGDWKRQHYYKPTREEIIRASLYEWSPAPGFNHLISVDMDKISLDDKFVNFEIPTLIFEGKWDLSWGADKAEFMRKNHTHAKLEFFENSGHKIFADEPEKFFVLLKNFLKESNEIQITCTPYMSTLVYE